MDLNLNFTLKSFSEFYQVDQGIPVSCLKGGGVLVCCQGSILASCLGGGVIIGSVSCTPEDRKFTESTELCFCMRVQNSGSNTEP